MTRRLIVAFAALAVLAGVGARFWLDGRQAAQALKLAGTGDTDITRAGFGGDFRLVDHTGRERTLSEFQGKVVVLFFGYTHCPDVCPTTLATLHAAIRELGPAAPRVQVLFVSVDPKRDTPAVLAQYVAAFDSGFIGLTGDATAIDRVTSLFKVYYQRHDNGEQNYAVDHAAGIYLLDRAGRARILTHEVAGARSIADDIRILLDIG